MKNFKKNVSLILTVIMLSLNFGPTFTFAETGQIADKSEQPVTENAVAAPEKKEPVVSDLTDRTVVRKDVDKQISSDGRTGTESKTEIKKGAANLRSQPFNEDDFYISGVNFNGLTESGKAKLKAKNGVLDFPALKTQHGSPVSRIGSNGFKDLGIKAVSFPSAVTEIDPQAFYNNEISELRLPDTIQNIGYGAFSKNKIKKLILSKGMKTIWGFTFANNYLDEVVVPANITKISFNAFENNKSGNPNGKLKLVAENPETLAIDPKDKDKYDIVAQNSPSEKYKEEDFEYEIGWDHELQRNVCKVTGLTDSGKEKRKKNLNLIIPDAIKGNKVEVIGKNAFLERNLSSASKLVSVKLPKNILKIEDSAFAGNALTAVTLPTTLQIIEPNAFCYNDITELFIPNSVRVIALNAFGGNPLTSVEIDNYKGRVSVDFQAFGNNVKPKYLRVKESYNITVKADAGVTVTTDPKDKANDGDKVKINYSITDNSKELLDIKVKSGEYSTVPVKDNSFVMPKKPVTVEVRLKDKYTLDKWCAEDFEYGYYELGTPDDDFYLYEYSVKGFSEKGKEKLKSLKSVILPSRDTKGNIPVWVYEDAFKGIKMDSVEVPGNYTHIQNNSFKSCGLKKAVLHEGLLYANDSAFEDNRLSELSLPNSFKYPSKAAFKGNNLKHIKLPEVCESIGPESFMNNSLESVEMGSKVRHIYSKAFAGNKLTEVNIPKSLKNRENGIDGIKADAFDNNPGKRNPLKPNENKVILWTPNKDNPNKLVNRGNYIVDPKLPQQDEEKWQADDFIYKTLKLNKLENGKKVPVELNSVAGFSDKGREKVKTNKDLVLPNIDTKGKNVEAVDDRAFVGSFGTKRLNTLKIPEGYVYIGSTAFAFNGCGGELVLPDSMEYVGPAAFFRNEFTGLVVPAGMDEISSAMMRGNRLSRITFKGNNLVSIGRLAFAENRLEEITVPDSLKSIGAQAFTTNTGSDNYKGKLIIHTASGKNPNKLKDAENYLIDPKEPGVNPGIDYKKWTVDDFEYDDTTVKGFSEQGQLKIKKNKNLVIPDKTPDGKPVLTIGIDAFRNLNKGYDIESIRLPETVTVIEDYAFQFNNIDKFKMPRDLKKLGMGVFMMSNVTKIEWNDKIEYIDQACFFMCELGKLEIPASVRTVMNASFRRCNLTEVKFAKGSKLKTIESLAFADNKLKEITLPNGLESIGSQAFGDNQFKELDAPASLKNIGFQAFVNNPSKKNPAPVVVNTPEGKNPNGLTDDQGKTFVIDPKKKADHADKAELKKAIDEAEKIDSTKLTSKFKEMFDETLQEGKNIYADSEASQASVRGSIKSIRWIVRRSELSKLMFKKEELEPQKNKYDADKWANVETAYKEAKENLFYINISDEKVAHLINTLSVALKALDEDTDELKDAKAYEGEFRVKKTHYIEPYTIKVKVWVKNGIIVHVINNGTVTDDPNDDEEHNGGYFKQAVENLSKYKGKKVSDVKNSSSSKDLGIDAISGATISSVGIHEAIRNALSKVQEEEPIPQPQIRITADDPSININNGVVAKGNQIIYTKGKSKGAEFKIIGLNFDNDSNNIRVMVDGQTVAGGNAYTLRSGSIIIGFKKTYLDSLKAGNHDIAISTGKGNLHARILIREDDVTANKPYENITSKSGTIHIKHTKSVNSTVKTGDSRNFIGFTLLLVMSAALTVVLVKFRRREE